VLNCVSPRSESGLVRPREVRTANALTVWPQPQSCDRQGPSHQASGTEISYRHRISLFRFRPCLVRKNDTPSTCWSWSMKKAGFKTANRRPDLKMGLQQWLASKV